PDCDSVKAGDLTFKGTFSGTLSTTTADIQTAFLDPIAQDLVLGGHKYTVALDAFFPPGLPDATDCGTTRAHVGIADAGTQGHAGGDVADVPEPGTLLLTAT